MWRSRFGFGLRWNGENWIAAYKKGHTDMVERIKRKCFIIVKILLDFICVYISRLENKKTRSLSPIWALTVTWVVSRPLIPGMLELQQIFIISPAIFFFFFWNQWTQKYRPFTLIQKDDAMEFLLFSFMILMFVCMYVCLALYCYSFLIWMYFIFCIILSDSMLLLFNFRKFE